MAKNYHQPSRSTGAAFGGTPIGQPQLGTVRVDGGRFRARPRSARRARSPGGGHGSARVDHRRVRLLLLKGAGAVTCLTPATADSPTRIRYGSALELGPAWLRTMLSATSRLVIGIPIPMGVS